MKTQNKIIFSVVASIILFLGFSFSSVSADAIRWTGEIDGDLNKAGNYVPQAIPTVNDTLYIGPDPETWDPIITSPSAGTSNAGIVTNEAFGGSISGGTFYGDVINTDNGTINGGTFHGSVTNNSTVSAGTFNGPFIQIENGWSIVSGATFNDSVTNFNSGGGNSTIQSSDFNGPIIGYLCEGWGNDYSGVTDISGVTVLAINNTWDGSLGRVSTSTIVENYGNITGGIYDGDVLNYGGISGGTFYGQVILETSGYNGSISGGTFYGLVNNTNGGQTFGGTYLGQFSGLLYVSGGSYSGITDFSGVTSILVDGANWDGSIIADVNVPISFNNSNITGGIFSNTVNFETYEGSIFAGTFYNFVDNLGIIESGSFCQSEAETGGTIYGGTFSISNPLCYNTSASITVTSPTNLSVLSSWSPSISFTGSPTTCKYKMDGDDYVTLDCNSMSIPTPTNWPHLLTITAENPYGASTSTVSFIYSDLLGMIPTGSLSPIALPAPTHHTLGDIYNVIELGIPSETNDHTLSTSTTPTATTTHSTSEIYARLANLIDASTIKSGVTYLGVTGGGETPEPIEIIPTSLTPLLTPNDRTGFSLEDIYQLVKNNVRVTSSTHDITNSSTVALTQHSIEDIYRTLTALVQPGNVLVNNTYLGVAGGYDPREGLVAQYKMNDNASDTTVVDSSGNGLNGTATQNTSAMHSTGVVDGSLNFDGVSDYLDLGTSNDLKPTSAVSYSSWVYIPNTAEGEGIVISSNTPGVYGGVTMSCSYNSGNSIWELRFLINGVTPYNLYAGNIPTDEWANIVTTVGDGFIDMYVNGTNVYHNEATGQIGQNPAAIVTIGAYEPNYYVYNWFKGGIDDVRIYDRVLSQGEIDALYNSGNGTEN